MTYIFRADPLYCERISTLRDLERFHIQRVLEKEGGRVGRAAQKLAIPRSSLYAKIKEYGISVPARGLGVQN